MRERSFWLRYFLLVLTVAMFAALGCSPDNGEDGEDEEPSCVVVLADDFSGSLLTNWITGTNVSHNPGGPVVAIEDGRVVFSQVYDYIETLQPIAGNFTISFDVMRDAGSHQCADYYIELVSASDAGAIMRFRYGAYAQESINIGKPPEIDDTGTWDCILDPPYLQELDHIGDSQGTLALTYRDQTIQVAYTNSEGETITTDSVPTAAINSTTIRIWGLGGTGSERYIDNLEVCAWDPDSEEHTNGAYTFVNIADTQDGFIDLDMVPTLNDSGTVAFWAEETPGADGIFTGSGGELTTVLHVTEANMQDIWGHKSINASGAVAVQLQYLQNNTTIEVRQGDTRVEIFSSEKMDGENEISHVADPQLNDNGRVSFWKETWTPTGSRYGIYAGNGGTLAAIADDTVGADFFRFSQATSINNNGAVAFAARADGGEYALYKSDGATRTLIAAPNGQYQEVGGSDGTCAINNNGLVTFLGKGMAGVYMWTGMFSGDGESVTEQVLARTNGSTPFTFVLNEPAMNDVGDIAFMALHSELSSGTGLYAGNDPVDGKVLEAGDTLEGKEVSVVSIGRHSINNLGQIACFVGFTDGSQGIYRADPL